MNGAAYRGVMRSRTIGPRIGALNAPGIESLSESMNPFARHARQARACRSDPIDMVT